MAQAYVDAVSKDLKELTCEIDSLNQVVIQQNKRGVDICINQKRKRLTMTSESFKHLCEFMEAILLVISCWENPSDDDYKYNSH